MDIFPTITARVGPPYPQVLGPWVQPNLDQKLAASNPEDQLRDLSILRFWYISGILELMSLGHPGMTVINPNLEMQFVILTFQFLIRQVPCLDYICNQILVRFSYIY